MLSIFCQDRPPLRGRAVASAAIWACLLLSGGVQKARAQHTVHPAGTATRNSPSQSGPASTPASTGTVSGTVTGPNNALISGAAVTLTPSGATSGTQRVTDPDGRFTFNGVAPGSFTLSVSLDGFDPASTTGTLAPGQRSEVLPISLHLSTVSVVVNAVLPVEELQLEQLHAEEKQRVAGIFPNFFVSYNWKAPPLTARQKFTLATKNATDPGNLLLVGTVAGVQQADDAFPGYHQGAAGYGKRYGADLANLVAGTYMGGAVLPALFHQDPRYFYKGTGSLKSRFLYAISTAVICRGDNGHRQPAFAGVLGDLSAGAISNIYYPASDRQGARLTLLNGFLGIAGDAMNNVFQEFFLKKLTPKVRDATSNSAP